MHTLVTAERNGLFRADLPLDKLPTYLGRGHETLWLDLEKPDEAEIEMLRETFDFHPLAIEDAITGKQRPKVDVYDDYYFVVFYSACYDEEQSCIQLNPLYLFIGPDYIVTIHHLPISTLEETARRWCAPKSPLGRSVGALAHALLDAIVDEYFPLLDTFADKVEEMEDEIFERYDQAALERILQFKKDLLAFRRVVGPERDVMNVLLRREIPIFSDKDVTYIQDVYDHVLRTNDTVDSYRDLLGSVFDVYYSVQSSQLNQILKVLTITSIVLMSVTLVAGIYGMNFTYMPELEWRYGYAWALGLMVAISVGLICFFRRKRWI